MADIKTTVNPKTLTTDNKPLLMSSLRSLVPYVPKRSYRSKIDPEQEKALLQLVRNKSRIVARPEVAPEDRETLRTTRTANNNKDTFRDAGVGAWWENSDETGRGYVPSMLRRSLIPSAWKEGILAGIETSKPTHNSAVSQWSLENARGSQSSAAAGHFWPMGSTPYNTLKDAYMRFGAENQDYYKNNGVIPPANMKRNWTPEEQRLLDHMTPKDREKAETEANNIAKNTSQPANYKYASFRAALKDHFTKRANGNLPYQKTAAEKHAFIQGLLQKHAGCSSSRGRKQTVRKCNTQGQCKSAAQILWDSLTRKN